MNQRPTFPPHARIPEHEICWVCADAKVVEGGLNCPACGEFSERGRSGRWPILASLAVSASIIALAVAVMAAPG